MPNQVNKMDPLALQLLLDRFDTMEDLLVENGKKFDKHVEDDEEVARQVVTHQSYWTLFSWVGGSIFLTALTWILTHIK